MLSCDARLHLEQRGARSRSRPRSCLACEAAQTEPSTEHRVVFQDRQPALPKVILALNVDGAPTPSLQKADLSRDDRDPKAHGFDDGEPDTLQRSTASEQLEADVKGPDTPGPASTRGLDTESVTPSSPPHRINASLALCGTPTTWSFHPGDLSRRSLNAFAHAWIAMPGFLFDHGRT